MRQGTQTWKKQDESIYKHMGGMGLDPRSQLRAEAGGTKRSVWKDVGVPSELASDRSPGGREMT